MKLPLIIRIFSIIVALTVFVNCQRGGGGGGGGGGHGGTGIIGGVFGSLGTIFVFSCCCCCWCLGVILYCITGKPFRSNQRFIKVSTRHETVNTDSDSIFQSDTWLGRYYQDEKWTEHCPYYLSFDSQEMKVEGTGVDDVGRFIIMGIYSTKTLRMGLEKKYQRGTGNPVHNLGQTVTIQLQWDPTNKQFKGKWFMKTAKFRGEDTFQLKRDIEQQPLKQLSV